MRRSWIPLFILLPASVAAQEGRIAYSRSVQYDFEIPDRVRERMAEQGGLQRTSDLLLFFNPSESVMITAPEPQSETPSGGSRSGGGMATRLRMFSTSRSDQETLDQAYVRFEDGAVLETRQFMGREFLVSGLRPAFAWTLGSEQREYLGYVVQKATAEHQGSTIEAWFTMQIPVPGGPGEYGGLPGMILLVSVDDGHTVYAATDVDMSGLGGVTIAPPQHGEEISREEYERIVADKLEELEMMRGQRRGRRPLP